MAMTSTRKGKVMIASTMRPKSASDQAAAIADESADQSADEEGDDRGEDRDLHVDRIGAEDAREHVAAEIVGAERMRPTGGLQE